MKDTSEINLESFTEELQGTIIVKIMLGSRSSKTNIPYEKDDGTIVEL